MMKATLIGATVATSLLVGTPGAFAQAVVEFTPDQERTIYTTVTKERVRTAPPAGMRFSVGAEIPGTVELYDVPASVAVAPASRYRYTVWDDRVVLVDPGTRKVVKIIER